ncbi:MAG: hypothetical protein ACRC6A_06165, partial [Fusobacteriaceae bacterium]
TVDKYTSKKLFKGVSKITIEDREYVACVSQDSRYVYLIEPINASESIFRKVRLELDLTNYKTVIGSEEYLFCDGKILIPTNKNYAQARVKMLRPDAASYNASGYPTNGTQLFDNSTIINDVIIKMLNEDREGILGIKIDDKVILNLSSNVPDRFNIYRLKTARRSIEEITIEINTNQNDKAVEIQCVEIGLEAVKDK